MKHFNLQGIRGQKIVFEFYVKVCSTDGEKFTFVTKHTMIRVMFDQVSIWKCVLRSMIYNVVEMLYHERSLLCLTDYKIIKGMFYQPRYEHSLWRLYFGKVIDDELLKELSNLSLLKETILV